MVVKVYARYGVTEEEFYGDYLEGGAIKRTDGTIYRLGPFDTVQSVQDEVYYAVVAACMQPSGAYAKSIGRRINLELAMRLADGSLFPTPPGKTWSKVINVWRVEGSNRELVYERQIHD